MITNSLVRLEDLFGLLYIAYHLEDAMFSGREIFFRTYCGCQHLLWGVDFILRTVEDPFASTSHSASRTAHSDTTCLGSSLPCQLSMGSRSVYVR